MKAKFSAEQQPVRDSYQSERQTETEGMEKDISCKWK